MSVPVVGARPAGVGRSARRRRRDRRGRRGAPALLPGRRARPASRVEIEAEVVCRARDRRRSRGLRRRVEDAARGARRRDAAPPLQRRTSAPANAQVGGWRDGTVTARAADEHAWAPPRWRGSARRRTGTAESWWSTVTVEATPTVGVETLDDVVIRFAGDSGDGMQLVGDRFTELSRGVRQRPGDAARTSRPRSARRPARSPACRRSRCTSPTTTSSRRATRRTCSSR